MTSSTGTTTDFASLDQSMDTAMADQNQPALEAMLAPDFHYTHSTDKNQEKAEFIAGIMARVGPPRRELSNVTGEVHGDIAVTRGDLDIVYADGSKKLMRYVRVYRNESGKWIPISQRTLLGGDRS
jgi:hypothetical protein